MKRSTAKKLAVYSLVALILADGVNYLSSKVNISGTEVTAILKLISVGCLIKYSNIFDWKRQIPAFALGIFKLVIFWGIITIINGCFHSNDYWDWKFLILTSSFSFFIPYALVIGILFVDNIKLFQLVIKKLFVYGFLLLPLAVAKLGLLYARLMFPVSLFTVFSPYIKRKWMILILVVALFSVVVGFDQRSNVIRILASFLLIGVYYLRPIFKLIWLKLICGFLFLLPFIFLYLGLSGQFNIFKPFEDNSRQVVSQDEQDLTADTRTLLYQEVLVSVTKHGSFIWGGGGSAKYESEVFNALNDSRGRYGAEVGFLNTLLYSGIIGVILYLVSLITACYYAINYSNNFLCKSLALFLAFRWVLFFIEDLPQYDMNFYFLWIAIGLCFSNRFRNLSDKEITMFFRYVTGDVKKKSTTVQV